jgi:hypothetical protein
LDFLLVERFLDFLLVERFLDFLLVERFLDFLLVERFLDFLLVERFLDFLLVERFLDFLLVERFLDLRLGDFTFLDLRLVDFFLREAFTHFLFLLRRFPGGQILPFAILYTSPFLRNLCLASRSSGLTGDRLSLALAACISSKRPPPNKLEINCSIIFIIIRNILFF